MLECVYITRWCTGNVAAVSSEIPWQSATDETCDCCGDYVSRTERVYFIRCEAEGTLDYACTEANSRAALISFTDEMSADELRKSVEGVYLVPECGEPDYDGMYGKPI